MANEKIICEKQDLVAIADAIREKTGSTDGMTLGQMDNAIAGIESGGSGGGVSVETCTMTVSYLGNLGTDVGFCCLNQENVLEERCVILHMPIASPNTPLDEKTETIQKVVCCSPLIIYYEGNLYGDNAFSIDNTINCWCEFSAEGIALMWIRIEDGSNECSFSITTYV